MSQSRFAHLTQPLLEQLLTLSQQLGQAALAPIYRSLDRQAPVLQDGVVQTPALLKEVLQALAQAGMFGTGATLAEGGTALPCVVRSAIAGILSTHNAPVFDYLRQTQVAASLIRRFGSESQKQHYLPLLAAGDCFGTLCLTEAQAGSSLGDVETVARSDGSGQFHLLGHKKWIGGAEHSLCSNIIHLVLARIEGAEPGSRGLSLFIAPRFRANQGALIANGVALSGLNGLCGLRAVVNGDLRFGEHAFCVAELLGGAAAQAGQAIVQLNASSHERCVAAGVAAAANAARMFEVALDYGQRRLQGRALHTADPRSPQVAISGHPGVKLKLLRARALSDAAMMLVLYTAKQSDYAENDDAPAKVRLGLLAPVAKCWSNKAGLEVSDLAAQICAAVGCSESFDLDALARDARTISWLEGGEGTHSLELLARQVIADNGAALVQLLQAVAGTAQRAVQSPKHQTMAASALELGAELAKIALNLGEQLKSGHVEQALCQSSTFIDALGTIVVCWLSLDAALAAVNSAFEQRLFENCRYLHAMELESVRVQLVSLRQADCEWMLRAAL